MKTYILLFVALLILGCAAIEEESPPENITPDENVTEPCLCPPTWQPVCGVDGRTYANACVARCEHVEISYEGECVVCKDSDGGSDSLVKGKTTKNGEEVSDECVGVGAVLEYYCENSEIKNTTIVCPLDYTCKDGVCAREEPPPMVCSDTDEKDIYTKGTVSVAGHTYEDVCTDARLVKEYFCEGDEAENLIFQCPNGYRCEGGKCTELEQTCSDTDEGKDVYEKGSVSLVTLLTQVYYEDYCVNSTIVKEYYCVDNKVESEEVNCPEGYFCYGDECRESICLDSDGGFSIYERGTTTKGDIEEEDYCVGDDNGIEYYCSDNKITSTPFACPPQYVCSKGRCTPQ